MTTLSQIKQQIVDELTPIYPSMTKLELLNWFRDRVPKIAKDVMDNTRGDAFDLTHDFSDAEKAYIESVMGKGSDEIGALRERSYGWNLKHNKQLQLEDQFNNN